MNHATVNSMTASTVSYKLNVHTGVLDWSKGAMKRNSAARTCNNMPSMTAVSKPTGNQNNASKPAVTQQFLTESDLAKKVLLLTNMTHACRGRIPELLAREAMLLGATDFARLMFAVEERGNIWSDDERFYVFTYADGVVGSVWLAGIEVYSSLCPGI